MDLRRSAGGKTMNPGASSVRRRAVSSGFTLLEVLIALLIFVMASVVLGSAYVNVLNGYDLAQRANARNEDVEFARAQLLAEPDHTKAEQGGEFDSANERHVTYHAQIEPTQTADLFTVAFTCEINDPAAKKPETVTENFVVLRPTWSDPTTNTALLAAAKAQIAKLQGTAPP
jgi:general secretion pathway protein I